MRQWQHGQQDVDGGSSQVGRIYIHLEFGQLPGRAQQISQRLTSDLGGEVFLVGLLDNTFMKTQVKDTGLLLTDPKFVYGTTSLTCLVQ